ncbi:TetR/AcrR family transcriptional regulator [Streptomyces sp. NBC_00347]|uniref:TetR/AcrR family transcriptional regulator n=1 Tax=Streptomyces sp. NBC_00347 TaxID=2975721 RepID=UPI0022515699|nr:TetR/AcrR family transcriptional regulator [Streptomyces sp. NBC_00347]MCX5129792.1 TetR/AcrR family transcriptional regulator [Streptomyces sp. NBC_00347]
MEFAAAGPDRVAGPAEPGAEPGAGPGSARPGGRTARVREAVLRAAEDVLAERGFAHLDLADIARRADVGKTTVYRRWGTVAGLMADVLLDMAQQSVPRAETGSLLGDLTANARLVCRTLADPRQGALFKAVIAAATCDPKAAESLHGFYAVRVEEWAQCVREAVARGEVPGGTDPHEVIRAVSAPLYYRLLTTTLPLDDAEADRAAAAAAAAARAGAYVREA